MSDFYKIIPGKVEGTKVDKTYYINHIFIKKILIRIFIIIMAFLCTNFVFSQCISENTLENTIALGSIFATFGSAIVAAASLFSNDCYIRFSDNVQVLQNDLLKNERWIRWTFIKRQSRKRLLDSGHFVQVLYNAQVEFQLGSHSITIPLPTVKADFEDLPISKFFIKMICSSKQYETYLCNHVHETDADAYFLWDCVYDIYLQIVIYQICTQFVWIGCSLICTSIFFSFLYIYV